MPNTPPSQGEGVSVPSPIEAAEASAEALEEEALQIGTLRIEIIGPLVVPFLQLVLDCALWLFGGAEKAAADVVATGCCAWPSCGRP
jgi:hypothetical protein